VNALSQIGIDKRFIESEPYYMPVGNEVAVLLLSETLNVAGDPDLDALYGKFHHSLISEVKELPDKLLRIYGGMTRM